MNSSNIIENNDISNIIENNDISNIIENNDISNIIENNEYCKFYNNKDFNRFYLEFIRFPLNDENIENLEFINSDVLKIKFKNNVLIHVELEFYEDGNCETYYNKIIKI